MNTIRGNLTFSNVVSMFCLFLLLGGGTAFAAGRLAQNSVGSKQIKKEAVTPAKLSKTAKSTLTGPTGPQGPKGDRGEKGEKGEAGKAATELWAVVEANGGLARGRGATESSRLTFAGEYEVVFDQNVAQCDWQATLGNPAAGSPPIGMISVALRSTSSDAVYVQTTNSSGAETDESFHLAAFC